MLIRQTLVVFGSVSPSAASTQVVTNGGKGSTAAEGETIIAIVASCCADVSSIEGRAAGDGR